MPLPGIGLLIPDWVEGWLALAAAGAAITGLRWRIVLGFAAAPAFRWIIGPALRPWFAAEPIAMQAVIVLVVALMAVHSGLTLLFGRQVAALVVGTMLLRIFDRVVIGTFRGLGWAARGLLALLLARLRAG